jgi:hypothetical protein
MASADIFDCACLRFWVIPQEEPCWLGEVVLQVVPGVGGGVPVALTGPGAPPGTIISSITPFPLQSFSQA